MNSASGNVHAVSSAYVETYWTPGGKDQEKRPPQKRYRVRCRVRESESALLHLGSFRTLKEAEVRRDWAAMQLARGITPNVETQLFLDHAAPTISVSAACLRYLDQNPRLSEESQRSYRSLTKHIDAALGERDVGTITPNDVRELIASVSHLSAAPIGSIRSILAGALDNANIDPNPARHRTVKLPTRATERMDVPPLEHVAAIYARLPEKYVVPVAMLEATGARISELRGVEGGDVDRDALRVRLVGKGDKPRIVPLPAEIAARIPIVDRSAKVWPHATPWSIRRVMRDACVAAKIPHYHPHDLRHRYASRLVKQGENPTQISAWMGHSRTSITLDVYADVISDTGEAWRAIIH